MLVQRRPAVAAFLAALSLVTAYLILVVVATPAIPSALAVRLAISANWAYIALLAGASALQAYLFAYSRSLPCRLGRTKAVGTSSSVLASFTSFFGLTSVGCCGLLPFWVSIALGGGTLGVGASTFLVNNSAPLTILGLAVMGASIVFSARSIRDSLQRSPQTLALNPKTRQTTREAKTE